MGTRAKPGTEKTAVEQPLAIEDVDPTAVETADIDASPRAEAGLRGSGDTRVSASLSGSGDTRISAGLTGSGDTR